MSEYFRRTDPSLVHYEGISGTREYPATSDMESQMLIPADIKKFLAGTGKALYRMITAAMGNSCSGITDYTGMPHEEPLYQAGWFIWGSTWTTALP